MRGRHSGKKKCSSSAVVLVLAAAAIGAMYLGALSGFLRTSPGSADGPAVAALTARLVEVEPP